jgi:succinate dehydrogenase/fumarate reductase flavoprotein subunit
VIQRRPPEDTDGYQAVLVGASAGALLAAVDLAAAGVRVLVVEKSEYVGGGTAYSGGVVWAPANHRMAAKGIPDSAAEALAHLRAVDPLLADPRAGADYVTRLPGILAHVEDVTSLRWVTYPGLPDYYSELPGGKGGGRFLLPLAWQPSVLSAEATALVRPSLHAAGREREWIWGRALVGALLEAALAAGVDVWVDSPVVGLAADGAGVSGVLVAGGDRVVEVPAPAGVLLSTGGYEWDAERTAACLPGPRPVPQTPPSNTGDGHRFMDALGVPLALMDRTIAIPGVRIEGMDNDGQVLHRIFFQPLAKPHSLLVNRRGERFANETFFVDVAAAMSETGADGEALNNPAHFVFDQQYVDKFGLPPDAGSQVVLTEAASLEELAGLLGVPYENLAREVRESNRAVTESVPDRFARGATRYQRAFGDKDADTNSTWGTVERGPFRAIEVVLTTSGHRGGVRVDERGRVLGADGAVDGLYACGNLVAGTVTGAEYFSGTSLGHALVASSAAAADMAARCVGPA